jgi:hypothetical protein
MAVRIPTQALRNSAPEEAELCRRAKLGLVKASTAAIEITAVKSAKIEIKLRGLNEPLPSSLQNAPLRSNYRRILYQPEGCKLSGMQGK